MKKIIILLLVCWNIFFTYAEEFKILYLSSDSIRIGNTYLHVGDVFWATDTIYWNINDEMEYMSIQNTSSYIQRVIDQETLEGYKSLADYENRAHDKKSLLSTMYDSFISFIDYYINSDNHTSYRDGEKSNVLKCMEELLSQTYFLDQKICIPWLIPDIEDYILIMQFNDGINESSIPLIIDNRCITISKTTFSNIVDLNSTQELKCQIRLCTSQRKIVLSDTMGIIIL